MSRAIAAMLGAVLALACAGERGGLDLSDVAERDSAGIRIVEHGPGALRSAARWALGATIVEVGGARGLDGPRVADKAQELSRVIGAAVLPGDTIVVVDAGAGELRYFDPGGRHVRTIGRPGQGPGEFGALLTAFFLPPDTMGVWDFRNQRVTLFGADGRPLSELSIGAAANARGLAIISRRPGGGWMGRTRNLWYLAAGDLPESMIRDSVSYVLINGGGESAEVVASLPDHVLDVRPRTVGGHTQRLAFPKMFSPRAFVESGSGRVVTGVSDRFELSVYEAGDGRMLLRLDLEDRPVRTEDIEAELEAARERLAGRPAAEVERELAALRGTPAMESFPAFDRVHVGSDGSIWVRRFAAPLDEKALWAVFGPDGRLRATLATAASLELLQASLGDVVVLCRDEFDVESVARRTVVLDSRLER